MLPTRCAILAGSWTKLHMADEIKPPVTQGQSPQTPSQPSPISPQIKMPPMSPQTTPPPGESIPANLPTKEGMGSKAEAPASVFKSSIRTMQEDITATKKGQPPAGFQMEKQSEKDIKPTAEIPGPKITPPPRPAFEVKLGEPEKAKPLPGIKPPPTIPIPPPSPVKLSPPMGPGLAVPMGGGINKKRLIFLVGYLVIIVLSVCNLVVWFFVLRGPTKPETTISPTPTKTATLTPTPVSIEDSFSIVDSVNVSLGANFTTRFDNSINKELLISSREPGLYRVFDPNSGKRYTFSEFLSGLLIPVPAELASAAYNANLYLSVLYKSDGKNGYGFVVRLKEPAVALTALENWEGTMTQNLKDLFLLNLGEAASTTFLDNVYQDVTIRYRNFPDPNLTIDYAVVIAKSGENYLVITNSREHMYAIIDKMR